MRHALSILLVGCFATGGGSLAADTPDLSVLLAELSRAAKNYQDQALRFTCEEKIVHRPRRGRRRVYRFQYVYAYTDAGLLQDYRLPHSSRTPKGQEPPACRPPCSIRMIREPRRTQVVHLVTDQNRGTEMRTLLDEHSQLRALGKELVR